MTICITGGSGFIGTQLTKRFIATGHSVVIFDRVPPRETHPSVSFYQVDLVHDPMPPVLATCDAVIHLSGVSIFGRWTESYKQQIYESRVHSTQALVAYFAAQEKKPQVFVCASAVGWYGSRGDEILDESRLAGSDFLATVCAAWEGEAAKAASLGIRVVSVRTGIVLGKGGGMLGTLLPLFNYGFGGRMGSGNQWFSWIHMDDLITLYMAAVLDDRLRGPVNAVAPHPVRNRELVATLGKVLHRPVWLPAPAWLLRLIVGQFAEAILGSQRVVPKKLEAIHFVYTHPILEGALRESVGK